MTKLQPQTHKHVTTVNNKRPVNVLMAQAHFNYRGNSNLRNVFADFIVSQDLSYICVCFQNISLIIQFYVVDNEDVLVYCVNHAVRAIYNAIIKISHLNIIDIQPTCRSCQKPQMKQIKQKKKQKKIVRNITLIEGPCK